MALTSQFFDMRWWSKFFDVLLLLWSILVTGPSFMSISSLDLELWQFLFIRDWQEIAVLPSIWRLGRVRNTKFGTNVSNKMLLNAATCKGYSFYHFLVIKGKPTGAGVKLTPFPTQSRVNLLFSFLFRRQIAWCFKNVSQNWQEITLQWRRSFLVNIIKVLEHLFIEHKKWFWAFWIKRSFTPQKMKKYLEAHQQIPKNDVSQNYCSCDQACQFSAL